MSQAIREATAAELDSIVGLETELFGVDAWGEKLLRVELDSDRRRLLVAVEDDAVVGYAATLLSGDLLDLTRIAVATEHQRRGIGARLLAAVCDLARRGGSERVLLEVSSENPGARSLYERAGFTEIDRRPRYYRDQTDAIVMELDLDGTTEAGRESADG